MASGSNRIIFDVLFNTQQGKSSLEDVRKSLQEIQKLTAKDLALELGGDIDKYTEELNKAKNSAVDLQKALNVGFNKDLGTINVQKFNKSLSESGTNLQTVYNNLSKTGSTGQQAFRAVATQTMTANTQLKQSYSIVNELANSFKNVAKYQINTAMFNTLTGSLNSAVGYIKELDNSLNRIQIVTGNTSAQMADFAVQANNAAKMLGQTTTAYADAALIFAQQGLGDSDIAERTEVTLKMMNVLGESASVASENLTAILNNFNDSSKGAEEYVDIITALGATTASSADEIATGLSKFAAVADTVGLSYEYATSSVATLVAATRQSADTVGTAMKTLLARIQDLEQGDTLDDGVTLGKYSQALEKIGVQVLDVNGNVRQMDDILNDTAAKWDTLSQAQQTALAQTVAGQRQYTFFTSLMENWDKMEQNITTAGNAIGTLDEQNDIYLNSIEAHMNQLKAAQEDLYDSLFDSDSFKVVIDGVTSVINLVGNFVDSIGGGGSALLLLGTIALNVFGNQITQALVKVNANMQNAKSNAEIMKNALDMANEISQLETTDEKLKQIADVMKQIDEMHLQGIITEEQRNQLANYVSDLEKLAQEEENIARNKAKTASVSQLTTGENLQEQIDIVDNKNASQEEKKEALKRAKEIKDIAMADLQGDKANSENQSGLQTDISNNAKAADDALNEYLKTLKKVRKNSKEAFEIEDINNLTQEMDEVNNATEILISSFRDLNDVTGGEITQELKDFNELDKKLKKVKQSVIEYRNQMNNASGPESEDYKEAQVGLKEQLNEFGTLANGMRQKITEMKNHSNEAIREMAAAWEATIQDMENSVNGSSFDAQFEARIAQLRDGLSSIDRINFGVSVAQGFGKIAQAAMGAVQIFNGFKTALDSNASLGERFTSAFMSMSMGIGMVTTNVGALTKSMTGLTVAEIASGRGAEALANFRRNLLTVLMGQRITTDDLRNAQIAQVICEKLGIAATEEDAVAKLADVGVTKLLAVGVKELALSFLEAAAGVLAFMAPLLPFIAIGVAIAGVLAAIGHNNKQIIENNKELIETQKENEQLVDTLDKVQKKYQEVNAAFKEGKGSVDDLRTSVQDMADALGLTIDTSNMTYEALKKLGEKYSEMIDKQRELNKVQRQNAIDAASDNYDREKQANKSEYNYVETDSDGFAKKGNILKETKGMDLEDAIAYENKQYADELDKLEKLEEQKNNLIEESLLNGGNRTLLNKLNENSDMNEFAQAMFGKDGADLTEDEYAQVEKYYNVLLQEVNSKQKINVIEKWLNSDENVSTAKDLMKEAGEEAFNSFMEAVQNKEIKIDKKFLDEDSLKDVFTDLADGTADGELAQEFEKLYGDVVDIDALIQGLKADPAYIDTWLAQLLGDISVAKASLDDLEVGDITGIQKNISEISSKKQGDIIDEKKYKELTKDWEAFGIKTENIFMDLGNGQYRLKKDGVEAADAISDAYVRGAFKVQSEWDKIHKNFTKNRAIVTNKDGSVTVNREAFRQNWKDASDEDKQSMVDKASEYLNDGDVKYSKEDLDDYLKKKSEDISREKEILNSYQASNGNKILSEEDKDFLGRSGYDFARGDGVIKQLRERIKTYQEMDKVIAAMGKSTSEYSDKEQKAMANAAKDAKELNALYQSNEELQQQRDSFFELKKSQLPQGVDRDMISFGGNSSLDKEHYYEGLEAQSYLHANSTDERDAFLNAKTDKDKDAAAKELDLANRLGDKEDNSDFGFNAEAGENYINFLREQNEELTKSNDILADLAEAHQRQQIGYDDLTDHAKDYTKVLDAIKNKNKDLTGLTKEFNSMKSSVSNLLNVSEDLASALLQNADNAKLFQKVLNGTGEEAEEATEQLREQAAQLTEQKLNISDEGATASKQMRQDIADNYDVGQAIDADDFKNYLSDLAGAGTFDWLNDFNGSLNEMQSNIEAITGCEIDWGNIIKPEDAAAAGYDALSNAELMAQGVVRVNNDMINNSQVSAEKTEISGETTNEKETSNVEYEPDTQTIHSSYVTYSAGNAQSYGPENKQTFTNITPHTIPFSYTVSGFKAKATEGEKGKDSADNNYSYYNLKNASRGGGGGLTKRRVSGGRNSGRGGGGKGGKKGSSSNRRRSTASTASTSSSGAVALRVSNAVKTNPRFTAKELGLKYISSKNKSETAEISRKFKKLYGPKGSFLAVDPYAEINKVLDKINKQLTKLASQNDKLLGKASINALNARIAKIKELNTSLYKSNDITANLIKNYQTAQTKGTKQKYTTNTRVEWTNSKGEEGTPFNLSKTKKITNDDYGFTFDKKTGEINNSEEVINAYTRYGEYLARAAEQYRLKYSKNGVWNAGTEKQQAIYKIKSENAATAQENAKSANDFAKQYADALTKSQDTKDQIRDNLREIIELQIEKIKAKVELRVDVVTAQDDWDKFIKGLNDTTVTLKLKNDGSFEEMSRNELGLTNYKLTSQNFKNGLPNLKEAMSFVSKQLTESTKDYQQILDLQEKYGEDGVSLEDSLESKLSKKELEKLAKENTYIEVDDKGQIVVDMKTNQSDIEEYKKQLQEYVQKFKDELSSTADEWADNLSNASTQLDNIYEQYQNINDTLENQLSLLKLVKGETGSKQRLSQNDIIQRQNNLLKEQISMQKQEADVLKEVYKQTLDAQGAASENTKAAYDRWISQEQLAYDNLEQLLENLATVYENNIEAIFEATIEKFADSISSAYRTLEAMESDWELSKDVSDTYLDTVNTAYRLSALQYKYTQAIDSTSNVTSQAKLKKIMDEELSNLQSQDKLSQYDLERAEKRYEIAVKQMELEEAQNNKSTMRLRRDANGNYSYVYTADEDKLGQLRDDLHALRNELYNFDKEYLTTVTADAEKYYSEWVEAAKAVYLDTSLTEEQRLQKIADLENKYGKRILAAQKERVNAQKNITQSANEDIEMSTLRKGAASEAWQKGYSSAINLDEGLNYFTSTLSRFADEDLLGILSQQVKDASEKRKEYLTEATEGMNTFSGKTNEASTITDKFNESLENVNDNLKTFSDTIDELTGDKKGRFNDLLDGFTDLSNLLNTKYKNIFTILSGEANDFIAVATNAIKKADELKGARTEANGTPNTSGAKYANSDSDSGNSNSNSNSSKSTTKDTFFSKGIKNTSIPGDKTKVMTSFGRGGSFFEGTGSKITLQKGTSGDITSALNVYETTGTKNKNKTALKSGKRITIKRAVNGKFKGSKRKVRYVQLEYTVTSGTGKNKKTQKKTGYAYWSSLKKAINDGSKLAWTTFRSGGYTGAWGNSGKLAMLHEKELVLNKKDTQNILDVVSLVRQLVNSQNFNITGKIQELTNSLNNQNVAKQLSQYALNTGQTVDQNVTINADFSGVQVAGEIEQALNNLANSAVQYANSNRMKK